MRRRPLLAVIDESPGNQSVRGLAVARTVSIFICINHGGSRSVVDPRNQLLCIKKLHPALTNDCSALIFGWDELSSADRSFIKASAPQQRRDLLLHDGRFTGLFCYPRFGFGRRHFFPHDNGKEVTSLNRPLYVHKVHIHGGSSVKSGFEPGTFRLRNLDLTTRPPRT
ncbi:hypothetical protein AVEN_85160-1 [Araneus ventricosus]|uniref:Uncharacterized protein n=1 Tax=Araneus ventricosus TaxID=182803 RepID=A0A4Y2LEV4_ARAVE|nr:hypothetical protein AVEN_85160-1 [Araneus ventricosus]